jgi:ribulose-5-phosphate 4-epimerase/fuculose-1-phosphate aldolase
LSNESDESRARASIVAYARRLYARGLVAGASGNISVRLDDGTLIVTPTTRSLGSIEASDLVACAPGGASLEAGLRPTSELPLHLAAYRVRPDVRCVIHTHPTYCVAWSKTGALFPLDTVGAMESLGSIGFTRYARSGTTELAEICARAFAANVDTIVMERHGLSSVADRLETAFVRTDLAEQTAHIEHAAFALRVSNDGNDV